MDLNFIHLSHEQINDLYANQLVQTDEINNVQIQKENIEAIKGGNLKKIMWLVNDEKHFIQSDEDFHFLTEILNACHLNMNDIILINSYKTNSTLSELVVKYEPVFMILSCVPANWHNLESSDYTVQKKDTYSYLLTDSLEQIRSTKLKKSKLWLALKQMLTL